MSGQVRNPAILIPGKELFTHSLQGWEDPRAVMGVWRREKSVDPVVDRTPHVPANSPVPVRTTLSCPTCPRQ